MFRYFFSDEENILKKQSFSYSFFDYLLIFYIQYFYNYSNRGLKIQSKMKKNIKTLNNEYAYYNFLFVLIFNILVKKFYFNLQIFDRFKQKN